MVIAFLPPRNHVYSINNSTEAEPMQAFDKSNLTRFNKLEGIRLGAKLDRRAIVFAT